MASIIELGGTITEPVDLNTAKQFLRLPIVDATGAPVTGPDDDLIQNIIIPGARRQLETSLGVILANRKFAQYEDGFPFFPYFQSPYAPLFGAAFPFYFGSGPIASYPYPAMGGLQNQLVSPFEKRMLRNPVTNFDHIDYVGTDGKSHGLLPGEDFAVDLSSIPARVAPLPGQRWPVGVLGINSVAMFYSAGYLPPNSAPVDEPIGAIWQALTSIPQNSYVIDSNKNIELQLSAVAKTGKTEPTWPANVGATISDESAAWKNLGPISGRWQAGHNYTAPVVILDSNGYLQQLVVSTLTSGGAEPTWSKVFGAVTTDNAQAAWMNIGLDQSAGAADPPKQTTDYKPNLSIPDNLFMGLMQLLTHWYQQRSVLVTAAGAGGAHIPLPLHLQEIIQSERILDFSR